MKTCTHIAVPPHVPASTLALVNRVLQDDGVQLVTGDENPTPRTAQHQRLPFPAAQAYLGGIGRTTLHEYVQAGDIPAIRIGRRVLFDTRDLDRFLRSRKTKGGGRHA